MQLRKTLFALRQAPCVALLFLIVPVCLVWSGGVHRLPGAFIADFGREFLPLGAFLGRWLRQGIFPLWNPHLFCGYPTIETQQSALFYPFHTLTLLISLPEAGLLTAISVHLLIAWGATFLAFRHGCGTSTRGSALGAACYVMNGCYASRFAAGHLTYIYAISWLPLAIVAFARLAGVLSGGDSGGVPRSTTFWAVLTTVVNALMLLSGAPPYVIYAVYGQLVSCVLPSPVTIRSRVLLYAACWFFAALVAAPQWLVMLDYLPFAARSSGTYAMVGVTWQELTFMFMEFILPQACGGGIDSARFNPASAWESNSYPGVAVLVLIIAGLGLRSGCESRKGHLATLSIALLGVAFYLLLGGFLPGTAYFRNSGRAVILLAIVVSMSAARAFDLLFAQERELHARMRRRVTVFSAAAVVVLILLAVAVCLAPARVAAMFTVLARLNMYTGEAARRLIESLASDPGPAARCAVTSLLLAASAVGLLLAWCALSRRLPVFAGAGLLSFLLLADPAFSHLVFFKSRESFRRKVPPAEITAELEAAAHVSRAASEIPWRCELPDEWTNNSSQYTTTLLESYGYDPLMPAFAGARRPQRTGKGDLFENRRLMYQLLGVRYVIEAPSSGTMRIREIDAANRVHYCIAELAHGVIARDAVGLGPIDGKVSFVAPEDAVRVPPALLRHTEAELTTAPDASDIRYHWEQPPNRMRFLLTAQRDMMLIVKCTWLPGWRVELRSGGRWRTERPVRVNGWQIGVPLRSGDEEALLVYVPRLLKISLAMSALGIAGGAGFLLLGRWRGRGVPLGGAQLLLLPHASTPCREKWTNDGRR